jgi:hypothetical protein
LSIMPRLVGAGDDAINFDVAGADNFNVAGADDGNVAGADDFGDVAGTEEFAADAPRSCAQPGSAITAKRTPPENRIAAFFMISQPRKQRGADNFGMIRQIGEEFKA